MTQFNPLQQIKREFFALRNGIIADTLRKAGSPFKIIFGLNLPQISMIASQKGEDEEMARRLWSNTSTRESMLLAPMMFPLEAMTHDMAVEWVSQSPVVEVTDVLCHKLLRRMEDSFGLACRLAAEPEEMARYAAMRLLWHHLSTHEDEVLAMATSEMNSGAKLTYQPAKQIVDEIAFLRE